MAQYFIKPRTSPRMWWDQPMQPLGHPTVYPSDPVNTGVLNQDGAPIYKGADPIGFLNGIPVPSSESKQ